MSLLNIVQKKGKPEFIHGKLTVYAIVDVDPSEMVSTTHPIFSMIHNGLLVAQGNYKEQSSLKDFLQSELGGSLEDGLEEFIEKLDGLEGALDPKKLKDKMKNLDELKDFIPTPAKIVPFHSEDDVLQQEGDIFFVGTFKNMANANLSVNSFPILYQARYREQEIYMIKNEIDQLISQIEGDALPDAHYLSAGINIEEKINKEFIPGMLYSKKDTKGYDKVVEKFRAFLKGYEFTEDIDGIISTISDSDTLTPLHYELLELYARKITIVSRENYAEVDKINKEIQATKGKLFQD